MAGKSSAITTSRARALPIINRGNCVRNSGQRVIYGSRNVRERLSEGRGWSLIIKSAQLWRRRDNDYRRLEYQRALNTPMYILYDWLRLRAHAYIASPFLRLKSIAIDRDRRVSLMRETMSGKWLEYFCLSKQFLVGETRATREKQFQVTPFGSSVN